MWGKPKQTQGLELEVFVREAIIAIFNAVQEAGSQIGNNPDSRGAVVPLWGGEAHLSEHEQEIKFDISVTVGKINQDDLKPSIKVPTIAELGGHMSDRRENTNVSRVSFSVPVALPGTVVLGTAPNPRRSAPRSI